MRALKALLLLSAVVAVVISSCSSNTPVVSPMDIIFAPTTTLSTPISTFIPELTNTPTIAPISTSTIAPSNTPTALISKTRVNLSPELYLDENSSPDNLRGEPNRQDQYNFENTGDSKGKGGGFVYHFGNEEWVTALTWTRIFPFGDKPHPNEGELRQHYIQVWKDGKFLYSFPVNGVGSKPMKLLRYKEHWIFWFMHDEANQGRIVQDGILLNDLHHYDSAFSLFLLDGKPFFFFQRDGQSGVSFNNQEILLPYSNISYGLICCDGGGAGHWNPRGTDIMVGFYTKENTEYKYIEIGLR